MRFRLFFIGFLLFCGCHQRPTGKTTWTSKHHNLSFQYDSNWSLLPTLDTDHKTLAGVIDYRDGTSCIMQISPDLSQAKVPNWEFLAYNAKSMLQDNYKNKLLLSDSLSFHGYLAYRQVFLMHNDKWGLMKQIDLMIRTGAEFISIQTNFPVTESNYANAAVPAALETIRTDLRLR